MSVTRLSVAHASAVVLASAVALFGCSAQQPSACKAVDAGKVSSEVIAAARAHIDAFNAHDAEKAVSADMADIKVMFHGAPNDVGKAADLATTKGETADPLAHVDLSDETVDVGGPDFAVYHSTYDYTSTDPKTKGPAHEHGNYMIGFKRDAGGELKIAWESVSDTPARK